MRILVLGAAGFIGRHIVAELTAYGHEPVALVRRRDEFVRVFPAVEAIECDLAHALSASDWLARLGRVDVVVNAAGLLRGPDMDAVHVLAPKALYEACIRTSVKRVVLISAISARPEVDTDYARTKLAGEKALHESGLDWVILRPSLVVAKGSYGGTSLLRGLAGFPLMTPIAGDGSYAFSPLHADDLARAVRIVCETEHYGKQTLEPAGPEILSLKEILMRYRAWLGFPPVPFLSIPLGLMRVVAKLGDRTASGPISSNTLAQLTAGNAGDGERFAAAIGFTPRALTTLLAQEPAQVQDRWHARLFFLAPVLKMALVLMWLVSGVIGLFTGAQIAGPALAAIGLGDGWTMPVVVATSMLDLAMAALVFLDRRGTKATIAQLAVVAGYTAALTIALPGLWLDPLGPLVKNIPILGAILCHGAVSDPR
ncbi:MAG: SDR family oxidoreductase [Parvibaculaceae bacterium]